ncbi:MAG: hypothetical protein MUC96_35500 [Myxococcaceae bacterium]|jgi:hypothetical protein|nr:hypothetical protein [Myxococcaceae bacterium]
MRQRVVVVEGFLDRAFVKGFIERRGCVSLGASGQPAPKDPWGAQVKGGQYAFKTASGAFLRLVPAQGDAALLKTVRVFINDAPTRPVDVLLMIRDPDVDVGVDWRGPLAGRLDNLFGAEPTLVRHPTLANAFAGPGLSIGSLACWVADDVSPLLPGKQTLERLVVAAVDEAHPDWSAHVAQFLAGRPSPPASSGKEAAMALMAGWFSSRLSEGFFEAVWSDDRIAEALERRLAASDTLVALERLVS